MTERKAQKHLARARQELNALRTEYVRTLRDPEWKKIKDAHLLGENLYEEKMGALKRSMKDAKARIARCEKICMHTKRMEAV